MHTATEDLIHLRRGLIAHGYRVVPCAGKRAQGLNWSNSRWRADQIEGLTRHYSHATNTGILTGEVVAIDVDTPDNDVACDINAMVAEVSHFDAAPYRIGRPPKRCYIFRTNSPRSKAATGAYLINGRKCQIEAMGTWQQIVAYGVHPDTGRDYQWHNGSPAETRIADLPDIQHADVDALLERAEAYFAERGELVKKASKSHANNNRPRVADSNHPWSELNQRALQNLNAWVPSLGLEGLRRYRNGYNAVASFRASNSTTAKRRGRALNIQPEGICDHADENRGYSPIDLVGVCIELPPREAFGWLTNRVGESERPPANINFASIIARGLQRAAKR